MNGFGAKIFSAAICLAAGMFGQVSANWCCFDGIEIGADYLYWQSCNGELNYAAVEQDGRTLDANPSDASHKIKTKNLPSNWDSGFRVYGSVDKLWCDLKGTLVYTYFNTSAHSSVTSSVASGLVLTIDTPTYLDPFGSYADAKWKLEYRTFDAIVSHPLHVSCDSCFHVEAFSGLKWLSMEQHKHEFLDEADGFNTIKIKHHLDVSGIGPMFGVSSSYALFDCIKAVGMLGGSLMVAESKSHDHFSASGVAYEAGNPDQKHKSNEDCVCFPGLHLMSGITYETCLCNMEIGLRLGWEYVQWIGAPDFRYYSFDGDGVRSAGNERTQTFQGIFTGVNISF